MSIINTKVFCYIFLFGLSFGSYAATIGDCTEKPFEFSDLRELQKDELIRDYCECKRISKINEDAFKEFTDKGRAEGEPYALRYLTESKKYYEWYRMSYQNADRIKRILGSKYKYKKEPRCEIDW